MKSEKLPWIFMLFVSVIPGVLGFSCKIGNYNIPTGNYNIPCDNLSFNNFSFNNLSTSGWAITIGAGVLLLLAVIFWWVMFIDVFRRDVNKKALWIIVILFGSFLGAIIYYFAVRRKGNRKTENSEGLIPLAPPKIIVPTIQSPPKETASVIQSPPKEMNPLIQSPKENIIAPPVKFSQTASGKPNLEAIREQLVDYRKVALAKGYTKEQIKETFLGKGYPSYLIDEVLGGI